MAKKKIIDYINEHAGKTILVDVGCYDFHVDGANTIYKDEYLKVLEYQTNAIILHPPLSILGDARQFVTLTSRVNCLVSLMMIQALLLEKVNWELVDVFAASFDIVKVQKHPMLYFAAIWRNSTLIVSGYPISESNDSLHYLGLSK